MIVDSMRKYKQMAFEEGKVEGIREAIQEGIRTGIQQTKLEIARKMLHEQMDIALIIRVTKLSEAEILELKHS
jgi:predicted transposase/invertase (TIGR01784 family)